MYILYLVFYMYFKNYLYYFPEKSKRIEEELLYEIDRKLRRIFNKNHKYHRIGKFCYITSCAKYGFLEL